MIKGYVKYIALSVLLFSTISVVFRLAVVDNPDFRIYDLAVNLLSEFAGMIFTVLVFNAFLDYRQRLANIKRLRQLYIELEELMKGMAFPFLAAAGKCGAEAGDALWTEEVLNSVRDNIVLSQVDDCVFPAVPWYMIFTMEGEKAMRKCENILLQYHDILEERISDSLFYFCNHSELLADLSNIQRIYEHDKKTHYTRPETLGSYFACPTDRDFAVLQQLDSWIASRKAETEKQAAGLSKYKKRMILVMAMLFLLGAVGYLVHGSIAHGGLFAVTAITLLVIYQKYYRGKQD